ncbi:MAG: YifB family Mg chelatase-like AAA ATPase [Desulfatitalea sp.]|nr:YifB family Mg chelatase-like AAA ATPase [Desulfatitalea sp.]
MLAKVLSSAVIGVDAYLVEVEIDIASGLPAFAMVGLPEVAVKESKERVRSAIKNSGYPFPDDRVTVNLAPAHIKKVGTGFDLPIAMGILAATGMIPPDRLRQVLFLGELSLDGRVKGVRGSLSMALAAREAGFRSIVVPHNNRREAAVVETVAVYPVHHLSQAVAFICDASSIPAQVCDNAPMLAMDPECPDNFADVKGQTHAKRALEVAAAGGHNLLMTGPPGAGKTMLARRLPSILPPLNFEEAIETTKVYSVVGMLDADQALIAHRTFRAPHHTTSDAGLIGGGMVPRPGEVSLAHNGVLFLDELPEYKKHVLEVLRQPLEDGCVTISRASSSVTFPARVMLVAAMNPCPCGYHGDPAHACTCTPRQIHHYRSRISGPLMDRIDIHIEVPAVPYKALLGDARAECSEDIRARVMVARQIQAKRYGRAKVYCNAQMGPRHIKRHCRIGPEAMDLLEQAIERLGLSARALNRLLKIARTIADLAGEEAISMHHIGEAIQYRSLDRKPSAT